MNCRTARWCRTIALLALAFVGVVVPSYAQQVAADFDKGPDLLVAFHGATKENVALQQWGYSPRFGGGQIDVKKVLVGTLVVDLIDARAKHGLSRNGVRHHRRQPSEERKEDPQISGEDLPEVPDRSIATRAQ